MVSLVNLLQITLAGSIDNVHSHFQTNACQHWPWASARLVYARFLPVNISWLPVKYKVSGTMYWLKQSISSDLLVIILCTQGPEASGSSDYTRSLPVLISKQNNKCPLSYQMPYASHARSENFHCQHPPPLLLEWTGPKVWMLTARCWTVPFVFG